MIVSYKGSNEILSEKMPFEQKKIKEARIKI